MRVEFLKSEMPVIRCNNLITLVDFLDFGETFEYSWLSIVDSSGIKRKYTEINNEQVGVGTLMSINCAIKLEGREIDGVYRKYNDKEVGIFGMSSMGGAVVVADLHGEKECRVVLSDAGLGRYVSRVKRKHVENGIDKKLIKVCEELYKQTEHRQHMFIWDVDGEKRDAIGIMGISGMGELDLVFLPDSIYFVCKDNNDGLVQYVKDQLGIDDLFDFEDMIVI